MFRKQQAFTLLELLITLVVLGVVMSIALPSFNSQILQNKSTALAEDFITAINYVRLEAIKQGKPAQAGTSAQFVTLCASTDGLTCSSLATDWPKGFIAVVDYATTEAAATPVLTDTAHTTSTILRVWPKQDINALINITQIQGGAAATFIRFTSSGKLAVITNPNNGMTIKTKMNDKVGVCVPNSGRQIQIGVVGLIRIVDKQCW